MGERNALNIGQSKINQSTDSRPSGRLLFRCSSAKRCGKRKKTNCYGRDLSVTVLYDKPGKVMRNYQSPQFFILLRDSKKIPRSGSKQCQTLRQEKKDKLLRPKPVRYRFVRQTRESHAQLSVTPICHTFAG